MAVYCAVYYTQRFCVTRAMATASAHVYARHLRTGWEELKGVVTPGDKSPVPDSGRSPAHGKSKIWHKNKWKVRRQRYMYDMLGLVKKGKVDHADIVFEKMKLSRVRPDTAVFNTLIGAHGKKGDLKKAFKLFNDLKKRKLLPSHHTYSSLFGACAAMGGQDGADVLGKIQEEMERRDVVLNIIAYNALMDALVKCGNPKQSFQVYNSLSQMNIDPTVETFSTLLLAASKDSSEGIDKALRTWSEMKATGIAPDSQCYGSLVVCLRNAGASPSLLESCAHSITVPLLSQVEKTSMDTQASQTSSKTLQLVSSHFTTVPLANDVHFKLFFAPGNERRWIENEGLDVFISHLKTEKLRTNIRLFQLLIPLIPDNEYLLKTMKNSHIAADDQFCLALIRDRLQRGDQDGARLLMKKFKGNREQNQKVYQAIASTCGSTEEVTQLLGEMKELEITPNELIFTTLIKNAVRCRQYDCLTMLMKAMRHHEISPTGAIIEKLEVAAGHTCKSAWLQKKQNGFKGYFNLWRKMMGDAP